MFFVQLMSFLTQVQKSEGFMYCMKRPLGRSESNTLIHYCGKRKNKKKIYCISDIHKKLTPNPTQH